MQCACLEYARSLRSSQFIGNRCGCTGFAVGAAQIAGIRDLPDTAYRNPRHNMATFIAMVGVNPNLDLWEHQLGKVTPL